VPLASGLLGNRPTAVYYSGAIYGAYLTVKGAGNYGMSAWKYIKSSGIITTHQLVADIGSNDAHVAPTLQIDSSGYIYIFAGSESVLNLKYWKSTNPGDISSFSGPTTYDSTT